MSAGAKPYQKFLGGWMRIVSNAVSQRFARNLEASDMTVAEWVVLRMVYECGPTVAPSDIARSTGLTRGAVSKLVDRIIEKGLAVRTESKQDRRYQEVKLTRKGKGAVPDLMRLARQTDDDFFSCLNASERTTLVRLLTKVAADHQLTDLPTD